MKTTFHKTGQYFTEKGQSLVEYAMIVGFIAVAVVAVLTLFGDILITQYYDMINEMMP